MVGVTPTARTLKWLREHGFVADVVEKWQTFPGTGGRNIRIRRDLFGFADILALQIDPDGIGDVILIQATGGSGGAHAARRSKIEALELAQKIRESRVVHIEVWSWAKQGARGKRKLWKLRRERWILDAGWVEVPPNAGRVDPEG